jgi:hypothetical protein
MSIRCYILACKILRSSFSYSVYYSVGVRPNEKLPSYAYDKVINPSIIVLLCVEDSTTVNRQVATWSTQNDVRECGAWTTIWRLRKAKKRLMVSVCLDALSRMLRNITPSPDTAEAFVCYVSHHGLLIFLEVCASCNCNVECKAICMPLRPKMNVLFFSACCLRSAWNFVASARSQLWLLPWSVDTDVNSAPSLLSLYLFSLGPVAESNSRFMWRIGSCQLYPFPYLFRHRGLVAKIPVNTKRLVSQQF